MVIFIDESGTHKQVDHATIALVYLQVSNLDTFEKAVVDIEKGLKIYRFHWTDESWEIRENFIKQLIKLDFTLKVAVLKNPIKLTKSLEEALKHLIVEPNVRKIVLDGRKPAWYEQRLKKILRDQGVSVKKLKSIRKDESSPGLRVADCLAGLIRYCYDHSNSNMERWHDKLKKENKLMFELTSFK